MSGLAKIIEENIRLRELLEVSNAKNAFLLKQNRELEMRIALLSTPKTRANERYLEEGSSGQVADEVKEPPAEPVQESEAQADEAARSEQAKKDAALRADKPEQRKKRKGKPKRRNVEDMGLKKTVLSLRIEENSTCRSCGQPHISLGESVSHRLEWVPGHFREIEVRRARCCCRDCPEEGVLTAPSPFALARALCGNQLLAKILIDKYADHLPLDRQCRRFARMGVELSTSTMCGWLSSAADLLTILAVAIKKDVKSGSWIQGDDSGLPVQDNAVAGQLTRKRLWAFSDQKQVFYEVTESKEQIHPVELLTGFSGDVLLADGGVEFNEVVRRLNLDRAGCWAHARRYFSEAKDPRANQALALIRDLFLLERRFDEMSPIERLQARLKYSQSIVDQLYEHFSSLSARPQSGLGEAITYLTNQESKLRLFLRNGAIPIHNNLSELMLRQPIVGRKNWLFAGSMAGAKTACIFYTLIGSCRLQELDPYVYLVDVFERIQDWPSDRIEELMPRNWRAFHEGRLKNE